MTSTLWTYAALDADGLPITGEIRAGSESDAAVRVRNLGYRPTRVTPRHTNIFEREFELNVLKPRVKAAELAGSIRQLAAMLRAGVPMMRGLGVLVEQSSPALAASWRRVRTDVESGDALASALARHPRVFDGVLVSLVRAGEASGTLDRSLAQAATALERKADLRRKLRSALSYPIAVLALVAAVILAMTVFVVPVFREVYADLGGDLPAPTRLVLAVSGFIGGNLAFLAAGAALAVVGLRRWKATPRGDYLLARATLAMPLVGDLVRRTALARAARTLAVLAAAGVPLLESLDIAADVSGNAVTRRALREAAAGVRAGRTLSSQLAGAAVIPPLFSQVIAVGEESGDLTEMLDLVSDIYEAEVDTAAESFSSVAEPMLIAFLGVVVGGIVLSLYLPMFKLVDLVQ